MGEERLRGLSVLSIESKRAQSIDFDEVINEFALAKSRKVKLI